MSGVIYLNTFLEFLASHLVYGFMRSELSLVVGLIKWKYVLGL